MVFQTAPRSDWPPLAVERTHYAIKYSLVSPFTVVVPSTTCRQADGQLLALEISLTPKPPQPATTKTNHVCHFGVLLKTLSRSTHKNGKSCPFTLAFTWFEQRFTSTSVHVGRGGESSTSSTPSAYLPHSSHIKIKSGDPAPALFHINSALKMCHRLRSRNVLKDHEIWLKIFRPVNYR